MIFLFCFPRDFKLTICRWFFQRNSLKHISDQHNLFAKFSSLLQSLKPFLYLNKSVRTTAAEVNLIQSKLLIYVYCLSAKDLNLLLLKLSSKKSI